MQYQVIIVEDEILSAIYLQKIIEENNDFKVVSIAKNAQEVLNILKKEKIDVIFIDIMLQNNQSGTKLALEIAKKYPEIILVFASAYSEEQMLQDAAKAKAFAYLLKPYRPKEIKATLMLIKERLHPRYEKNRKLYLIEGYYYDFKHERLCKNNQEIPLSKEELALIKLLAKNHTIILDKETILNHLNITNEALRALIYRIRNSTCKALIQNHKRFGYKLATTKS